MNQETARLNSLVLIYKLIFRRAMHFPTLLFVSFPNTNLWYTWALISCLSWFKMCFDHSVMSKSAAFAAVCEMYSEFYLELLCRKIDWLIFETWFDLKRVHLCLTNENRAQSFNISSSGILRILLFQIVILSMLSLKRNEREI